MQAKTDSNTFFNPDEVDVVIVGAGPIGLLNAIGLLNKNPARKIMMLEKYDEYQRHHVVQADYKQIAKYIKAMDKPLDPILQNLLKRVKKSKFIRTSEIEKILKERALELGAQIKTGDPVVNVQQEVFDVFPNAKLILGADGSHSVISKEIFGADNIQKYPFDFVMQLRYEIEGDAQRIELPTLVKFMQSYGLTCDEYVGKKDPDTGKTPVTFQLMITKEQFDTLYPVATSKNPILPFSENADNLDQVEPILIERLKGYLGLRLRHFTAPGQIVDLTKARISVNEAPATRAAKTYKITEDGRLVVLVGDAQMGLSYFKGLNAGIESSAKLLPALSEVEPVIRDIYIQGYFKWFDEEYAPKKVKEVEDFSTFRIRLLIKVFKTLNFVLGKDFLMRPEVAESSVDLYLGYLASLPRDEEGNITNEGEDKALWSVYPHRDNAKPVLAFVPRTTAFFNKSIKNFSNWGTPYKTSYHIVRDILLPLRSLYQLTVGTAELVFALPIALVATVIGLIAPGNNTRGENIKENFSTFLSRSAEGILRIILGINLAMTSLVMPFRVITRSAITLWKENTQGPLLIENNPGIVKLLAKSEESESSDSIEKMNALRVDIHTKFKKDLDHGQFTGIEKEREEALFKACRPSLPESYNDYFRLFKNQSASSDVDLDKKQETENDSDAVGLNQG